MKLERDDIMDISFLLDYIDIVTLGICLCLGFAVKYAKIFDWLGNQYIPLIMLVIGTVINIVIHWGGVDAQVVLGGMISGLASTGLYEMVRNLIDKNNKQSTTQTEESEDKTCQ